MLLIQAGQETFKSITRSYYRGSIGVILVYDITSRESFNNVNKWLDETKSYSNDKITAMLIANKTDLDYKYYMLYLGGLFLMMKVSNYPKKIKCFSWSVQPKLGKILTTFLSHSPSQLIVKLKEKKSIQKIRQLVLSLGLLKLIVRLRRKNKAVAD